MQIAATRLDDPPSRFSRRRRVLLWVGVAFALAGSLAILYASHRQSVAELRGRIARVAGAHGLNARLVEAVVYAESKGDPRAVSRAQAYGLMQLRIPTAREMAGRDVTVDELFEPELNLDLGCRYLRRMLDRYDGSVRLALMAYNAGPGNVDKWRKRESDPVAIVEHHAFGQTRAYVKKVLHYVKER